MGVAAISHWAPGQSGRGPTWRPSMSNSGAKETDGSSEIGGVFSQRGDAIVGAVHRARRRAQNPPRSARGLGTAFNPSGQGRSREEPTTAGGSAGPPYKRA